MPIKKFKCEYYQLMEEVEGERDALFDLEAWFNIMEPISLEGRSSPYKEDSVRLEEYYYHPTYEMWFLRFMRQRINDVPSLSRSNTPSEFMELEEDQFVSEDVTCLFDPTNNVLMIQKNSHSVSPVGIELYFNATCPQGTVVKLRKVVSTDSFQKVRNARNCRKVTVRLADLPTLNQRGLLNGLTSTIGTMIRSMREVPSPYIELTFSVGMDRNAEINEEEVQEIVNDIANNPMVFDRAKLSVVEEDETKQSIVDLLLDSPNEEIRFDVERNNPVRFDALMDAMAQKYCPGEFRENRKAIINTYLRP